MPSLKVELLELITGEPGLTDRELINRLRGTSAAQQPINQTARILESQGAVARRRRDDGLVGNYTTGQPIPEPASVRGKPEDPSGLSEDELKERLKHWLEADGWECEIAWGRERGIDIDASREDERWIIEVKGIGSRQAMRVNYFIGMLGETLQRMDDPDAMYSIAMPDVPQFRGLWNRLPELAKRQTTVTALFVTADGAIDHLGNL